MAWNDAPPTKEELQASNVSWDSTPPTKEELGTAGAKDNSISAGKAALIGGEAGISGGLRPFVAGVGGAAGGAKGAYDLSRGQGKGVVDSIKDAYEEGKKDFFQARQDANTEQAQAASEHPGAYYGANLAGGLLPGALIPGSNLKAAAGAGAGFGAANALSSANSAGDAAKDVAGGALLGGAFYGGAKAVSGTLSVIGRSAMAGFKQLTGASPEATAEASDIISKAISPYTQSAVNAETGSAENNGNAVSDFLQNKANLSAFKSVGPFKKDMKGRDLEDAANIGNTLLKEGVVRWAPTSAEGLAERAENVLTQKGQQIGDLIDKISDAAQQRATQTPGPNGEMLPAINLGPNQKPMAFGVSKQSLIQNLEQEFNAMSSLDKGAIRSSNLKKQYANLVDNLKESLADEPELIPLNRVQQIKVNVGKDLAGDNTWARLKSPQVRVDPEEKFNVSYYHALSKGIDDAADYAAPILGPDVSNQLKGLRQDFAALKAASMIANNKANANYVNRMIAPSDYMVGAAGFLHNPLLAGAAIVNHAGLRYGNQVKAMAYQAGSKAAATLGSPLQSAGPIGGLLSTAVPAATQTGTGMLSQQRSQ